MIMESETQPVGDQHTDSQDTDTPSTKENMAPPENDNVPDNYEESDSGEVMKSNDYSHYFSNHWQGGREEHGGYYHQQRVLSTDEGEMDTAAEDGEILEDGEIASDQEGEIMQDGEEGEYPSTSPNKASPNKSKGHKTDEPRDRSRRNRKERHSKRRRSKEDGHKEKQSKKKRHRDYDYDKTADDYDQNWMTPGERPEKRERKDDRSPQQIYHSPSHDSHGEEPGRHKHDKDGDKHRRGSGDNRRSGRDREKSHHDREKKRDKNRDGSRDRSERGDKHEKNKHDKGDRESRRERHGRDPRDKKNHVDGYDDEYSPPGIYDSPSDEDEYGEKFGNKKPKTMMSMVEDEYMDPSLASSEMEQPLPNKNNIKKKQKKWLERRRPREIDGEGEFEMEQQQQPVKKKPLILLPMEERPLCRFYKEGKCQKGADCNFNHGCKPAKRLELCKYYVQSYCRKMDECVFMHAEFPCKYFHTGSTCYQGDNCKFSHDPLTEVTEIALQQVLNDRDDYHKIEEYDDGYMEHKKFKKKALLGDQPLSREAIEQKLQHMKSIPSIFDIETHAPVESPRKPKMGQSPSMIRPPGYFNDSNMSPQGGPNIRFNGPGPMNQGTPPRPPFMNGPPQGMDSSPMGMQGPPMSGPGPGMMGPAPPGMIQGPGMQGPPQGPGMQGPPQGPNMQGPPQGPGMQGPPMGPPMNNQPMSQAAALVGALLRAAPMLQQYRGPATSMPNDQNFNQGPMGMMGGPQGPPMQNMGPNQMMGPPGSMEQQQEEGRDGQPPGPQMSGQGGQGFMNNSMAGMNQNMDPGMNNMNTAPHMAARDPRKMAQTADIDMRMQDMDMSSPKDNGGAGDNMDEDLRQDVDLRQSDNNNKNGNTTPQQDWDESSEQTPNVDDMDIPAHLPPKQREMFIRIRQHTMKMNQEKNKQEGNCSPADQSSETSTVATSGSKAEDNWYSSDEEDDVKPPHVANILESLNNPAASAEPSTSFNVLQMINAAKNNTPNTSTATTSSRPSDPRKQASEAKPVLREPTIINSQEGDCPWRLCRVLYVRQRIPDNLDFTDSKYKNDPRVQKMLKLQELESGQVIDHSKTQVNKPVVKSDPSDPKLPLLDPRIFNKEPVLPRPELAPFVDPSSGSGDTSEPRVKQEPNSIVPNRPTDPRKKPSMDVVGKPMDPRMQQRQQSVGPNVGAMHNPPPMPSRPLDPRLGRQDSNSGSPAVPGNVNPVSRPLDPRLVRQNSRDVPPPSIPPSVTMARSATPPLPVVDPRLAMRQNSSDPRTAKLELLSSDSGITPNKPLDPRLGRVAEADPNHGQMQKQFNLPGSGADFNEGSKPKVDYRNDPRFKRKHISESTLSPDSLGKRFTGQRKSSTEYSSPLGVESTKQEDSGYNSYNRPRPVTKTTVAPHASPPVLIADSVPAPSSDITTHDILDSLQVMPSQAVEQQAAPDKNLKDIFKTIDPTASPFC